MRKHPFYKGRALDEELRSIYEVRGKLPDMSRLEHEYHRRTTRILVGLLGFLVVVTAASWFGFFLFGAQSKGGGEVEMRFDGPASVVSGVPQELTLAYANKDRNPLAFASIRLRVPERLMVKEADPQPDEQGQYGWNFGTLAAKARGEIHLTVIPYGILNDQIELPALFTYKPANFNAEFQTPATHTFTIAAPAITATLAGPSEATPGQQLSFAAHLKNETGETFQNVRAALSALPEFTLQATDPHMETDGWQLGTLAPNDEKDLTFKGTFLSNAAGPKDVKLLISTGPFPDALLPLGAAAQTVAVQGSDLEVDLIAHGSPDQQWVRLGQTLPLALKLVNKRDAPIDGLRATIAVNGTLIDWKSTTASSGTVAQGTIAFPQTGTMSLAAHETRELNANLSIAGAGSARASPFIELTAHISEDQTSLETAPLKLIVVSDMTLASEARYFGADGTPVGAGPLPPKVGEESDFALRFKIKNSFHDLSNVVVAATLPQGVIWKNQTQVSAGKLTYNEASREVRWEIPRMPVSTQEITGQFMVGVVPNESDRGKLVLLLGVSRAEALDTIAQVTFSADAPSVSSNLDADAAGKGKGVVQ